MSKAVKELSVPFIVPFIILPCSPSCACSAVDKDCIVISSALQEVQPASDF